MNKNKPPFLWLIAVIVLLFIQMPFMLSCQKNPPQGHPFRWYFERRLSNFDTFPVTSDGIVFLGDSLTDEARWGDIFPDQKIFNRGVGADRTEHLLTRLDQVTTGQPAMIFIMIGTNDLGCGIPPATIVTNYRQILHTIQIQSPRSRVFVQSLLPRHAEYQKGIEAINKELQVLAHNYGYTYIDLYADFIDKDGSIKDEYANDELHLLGPGYLKWKAIIAPHILPEK